MRTRLFAVLLAAALLLCAVPAAYAEDDAPAEEATVETAIPSLCCAEIPLYESDRCLGTGILINSTTYVPLRTFTEAVLNLTCEAEWLQTEETVRLCAEGLELTLALPDRYLSVNGRLFFLGDQVQNLNGTIVVPIRVLASVFQVEVTWFSDEDHWMILLNTENAAIPVSGAEFYPAEDLYWLSHVIYAEAGNQPLEGMIGVGNVVLNRAAEHSPAFGDGIRGVIFQPGQFDVVAAGTIYMEPSTAAVAAAKLCLEGCNTVGTSKWFLNPAIASSNWFDTYTTFAIRICDHDFYA